MVRNPIMALAKEAKLGCLHNRKPDGCPRCLRPGGE